MPYFNMKPRPRATPRKATMKSPRGDVIAKNRLANQPQGTRITVGTDIYERSSPLGLKVLVKRIGKAPKY